MCDFLGYDTVYSGK